MYTEEEAKNLFFNALKVIQEHSSLGDEWLLQNLPEMLPLWRIPEYLYKPDERLIARIDDYKTWCKSKRTNSKSESKKAGELLEEIVLLAFLNLKGFESIESYQSYAAQFDLVISGSGFEWLMLMDYLHLKRNHRTILVEAKNWSKKVDDKVFSRLCGILENVFASTAELAVFVTRKGATGFPINKTTLTGEVTRLRVLRDAQASQILFHARTGKYVVVLDDQDIQELVKPGALPRILEAKIKAVEQWTGLPIEFADPYNKVDLPEHLLKHMR